MLRVVTREPEGQVVPYMVRLDDGRYVYVPMDSDGTCRALVPGEDVATTGTEVQPVAESEDDETEEEPVIEAADGNDPTAAGQGGDGAGGERPCFKCSRTGHWEANCPIRQPSYGLPFRKRIVFVFGSDEMTTARVQFPIPNPEGSASTRVEITDRNDEEAHKVIMKIDRYKGQQDILAGFLIYALIALHHEDEHQDLESKFYFQFTVNSGIAPWWLPTTPGSHGGHIQAETMVFPSRSNESRGNLTTYSNVIWNIYQVWLPALKAFFKENLTAEMVDKVTSSLRYYEAPSLLNIVEFNDPTRDGLEEGEGNLPLDIVEHIRDFESMERQPIAGRSRLHQ